VADGAKYERLRRKWDHLFFDDTPSSANERRFARRRTGAL